MKISKINCSKKDASFTLIIGYLSSLVDSCVYLMSYNLEDAISLYSGVLANIFPDNPSFDNIDFDKIFFGEFSKKFIIIYKKMILLWEKIQEEEVNKKFTSRIKTDDIGAEFSKQLKIFHEALKRITQELETK